MDLDMKDRRLLYELDRNSRQPQTQIAKKIGLSTQLVGQRIKRLLDKKILTSFYSVIDISKLGFTVHKVFLQLQNLESGKEKELITFLKHHPNVVWLSSCDGKFDLAFGTWARDMRFLDTTLTELNEKYGMYIGDRQIATIIRGEYFVRDYLLEEATPSASRESYFGSVPDVVKLDPIDWNILFYIGKNARITTVELGEKINLSADAVSARIKRLEKERIINHYNIVPNESVYPYLHYKLLIRFRNISEDKAKMFHEYCHVNPNMVYIVKSLGPWDYEIDIEIETPEKYRELIMDLKTEYNDMIKDYSTLHIYQVHKYHFCPSVQME